MKGYKAFEKGMICRGKQYAENTVFEEKTAEICKSGMHFCKNPLDVLDYYPLVDENGNMSEFAEVEALDDAETDDGEKYCTKKLKIGAKIGFPALVQASLECAFKKTSPNKKSDKDHEKISSRGNGAQIGASGNDARIGASGDDAQIGASGEYARIGASGNWARIGASGNYAQIKSTGKKSVICCAGHGCCASAKIGSWITLAEWGRDESGEYKPLCVKTEYVDGERIKENTLYKLENGEFEEAKE